MDYRKRWTELEESMNPFAIIVMAHLKTQETYRNFEDRKLWKLSIIRRLYDRGYSRKDVAGLFTFIDWVMRLPMDLEKSIRLEVEHYEERRSMPYVTSIEKLAIADGLLDAIELGLDLKFGEEGLKLMPEIRAQIRDFDDIDLLKIIRSKIKSAKSLDEIQAIYQK